MVEEKLIRDEDLGAWSKKSQVSGLGVEELQIRVKEQEVDKKRVEESGLGVGRLQIMDRGLGAGVKHNELGIQI